MYECHCDSTEENAGILPDLTNKHVDLMALNIQIIESYRKIKIEATSVWRIMMSPQDILAMAPPSYKLLHKPN